MKKYPSVQILKYRYFIHKGFITLLKHNAENIWPVMNFQVFISSREFYTIFDHLVPPKLFISSRDSYLQISYLRGLNEGVS